MLDFIFGFFSHDLGIDLGTANTLVYLKGKGILIREPSVVAIHKKTKDILAIGAEAKEMVGKTPANILTIRPLREGVISDFEAAERMLKYFICRAHEIPSLLPRVPRPRVVVGIPSSVTEVERRAVSDAALSAGAREVHLVEEPMAAAIGAGLPVESPQGSIIVDIGGGTTEIAVISLGGIVTVKSLRVAGDKMDEAVVEYARGKFNLLLGERTAEEVKIAVGSAYPTGKNGAGSDPMTARQAVMRGRDLTSGLPKSIDVSEADIGEALKPPLRTIAQAVKETIEETPPELVADIIKGGVTLCGGGALLPGLDQLIAEKTGIAVRVAKDPMTCVVRGTGAVLDNLKLLERVRVV